MTAKVYEFNGAVSKPLVNLAYANGFLPQTYIPSLSPLFDQYRVISAHARPMWDDCPPESLKSWRQLGDDLLAILDTIADQPLIGIGHSVGSIATLYAFIKRPDRFRALILIDPTLLLPSYLLALRIGRLFRQEGRIPLVRGALNRRRSWSSNEEAYTYFRSKSLFKRCSDEMVRLYTESITAPDPKGGVSLVYLPEWEAQIYRTVATDVWRLPGQVKVPTLIIRGALTDVFVESSASRFKRLKPQAQIVTVAQTGHLVAQEQPLQTGQLIAGFLKSL